MASIIRNSLVAFLVATLQVSAARVVAQPVATPTAVRSAPSASTVTRNPGREWNDPEDIARVSRAFEAWTDAVIAKDRATVESFHDDGFRAGLGDRLLDKAGHVDVEMIVANREMKLVKVEATRRIGDILLVWSKHFIRADSVPEIPSLGLLGDWGDEKAAKRGFTQDEISVWRVEGDDLKCLAFAASRTPPRR